MARVGRAPGSKNARFHIWTAEEKAYLAEIVTGRSHAEICQMMRERFGSELADTQIKGAITRFGLNTGRTGYFAKGCIPPNKGRKGYCPPGCEKGWFPKGNVAANRVPIGTEKLRQDGYVWVKVADGQKNRNWIAKHVFAWEAANGPVPAGHCVMIKDGDPHNDAPENLLLVSRRDIVRFNQLKMPRAAGGVTEAGILVAQVSNAIAEVKRRKK